MLMPLSVKIDGMEGISQMLSELEEKADFVASMALYKGAGVMASEINKAAQSIQTAPFKYTVGGTRLPSPEEKEILLENGAMGIAKFDHNGAEVNTSVGYNSTGYARVSWNHMSSGARTNYKEVSLKGRDANASSFLRALRKAGGSNIGKGAQNLKPIGVIANAINSGTSFMKKQPFIRKGANTGSKKASEIIRETVENLFDQIINRNQTGGKTA